MADAKLTALTAASALAGADLFYLSQGGVSKKATGTQLLALVGTAYVPLAGGASMAGPLSLVNSTTQQIAYVYNTYTDASNYERLKLTGVAGATVNLTAETAGTGYDHLNIVLTPSGFGLVSIAGAGGLYVAASVSAVGNLTAGGNLTCGAAGSMGWSTSPMWQDAAASISLRNGTTTQSLRVYGTSGTLYNGNPTDYERLSLTAVSGTSVNIVAETGGTGADDLDVVLTPAGTGLVKTSGAMQVNGYIKTDSGSVAGLPAAATAGAGARAFVTDANATTYLSTVAGGGANKVPVVSDGTNWLIG